MTKSIKLNKQLRKAALKRIKPKQVAQLVYLHILQQMVTLMATSTARKCYSL